MSRGRIGRVKTIRMIVRIAEAGWAALFGLPGPVRKGEIRVKRSMVFRQYVLLFLLATGLCGCESRLEDPDEVRAVKLVWLPAHNLRTAPLEFTVDAKLLTIFVERLNLSREFDPVWKTKTELYEGGYEITVIKKNGEKDVYRLGGESVIYAPATKKYYQNKDLHLFIYQNLFLELIKRKIRIQ
jgi:hypothetical protein